MIREKPTTSNPEKDLGRDFPLAERSNDFIALVNSKGKIRYTNVSYRNILGYTKKSLLDQDFSRFYRGLSSTPGLELHSVIGQIQNANGTWRWVETSSFHFKWKGSKYIAYFSRDINERQRLESELKSSREASDTLIAHAPVGIYEIDFRGPRFLKVNDAMCQLSGYSREELLKKNPFELLDGESQIRFKKRIETQHKGEAVDETVEYKVIKKDGSIIFVVLNTKPIFENGHPIGAFVIGTDVTERRKMEEALLRSEEKYRLQAAQLETIFNNTPAIIWITNDHNARKIVGNKIANETLGVSSGTNVSKSGTEKNKLAHYEVVKNGKVLGPRDMPLQKVAATGEPLFDYEMDLVFENNVKRTLAGNVVPFLTDDREPYGAVGAFLDITERKKIEQQKDEFLAIASHELKTPITSLKAYNQFLTAVFSSQKDKKSVMYLEKMNTQINKLTALLNELLDITRIQSGKLQLKSENYQFNELVRETAEQLQLTSPQHTIELKLAPDIKLYGDRERVGQVITNLLSNAIKYSPESETIILSTHLNHDKITLKVKDFGLGISDENKARIFERFYRVEGRKKETYPGLGLGLYISSEIIKRHGGKIGFESTEGYGSTFFFSLPITSTLSRRTE